MPAPDRSNAAWICHGDHPGVDLPISVKKGERCDACGASESSAAIRRERWIVKRGFTFRPWRISTHLRVFRGNGLANFEFEFRLGFPRHSPTLVREIAESLSDPLLVQDGSGV